MVVHPLAAVEAGGAGSLYNGLEITIIGIAENPAKSRLDQNSLPAGLVRRMDSKGVISWLMVQFRQNGIWRG